MSQGHSLAEMQEAMEEGKQARGCFGKELKGKKCSTYLVLLLISELL